MFNPMQNKPKRGAAFIWSEMGKTVYLNRIKDDGKYFVCDNQQQRPVDQYATVSPNKLEPVKKQRSAINKISKNKSVTQIAQDIAEKAREKGLSVWFADQILKAPACCENCGKPLNAASYDNPRTIICHIVPKGKKFFVSVATHPLNRWFGCGICHTNYDTKGQEYQETMPVMAVCVERFNQFKQLITAREATRLPAWLYRLYTYK